MKNGILLNFMALIMMIVLQSCWPLDMLKKDKKESKNETQSKPTSNQSHNNNDPQADDINNQAFHFADTAEDSENLPSCDTSLNGKIFYLVNQSLFQVCNGSAWENINVQGPQGNQGPIGPIGPQGLIGLTGAQGIQGVTGATGPQGLQGPVGATGAQGTTGATGAQGLQGLTGARGTDGLDGVCTDKTLAVVDSNNNFIGRPLFWGYDGSIDHNSHKYYVVILEDGTKYLTDEVSFNGNYHGFGISSTTVIWYGHPQTSDAKTDGVCVYPNTSCTGECGFYNRPPKDYLFFKYDSSGNKIWHKTPANQTSSFTFNPRDYDASYRSGGSCITLYRSSSYSTSYNLSVFNNPYTLPDGVIDISTGLSIILK